MCAGGGSAVSGGGLGRGCGTGCGKQECEKSGQAFGRLRWSDCGRPGKNLELKLPSSPAETDRLKTTGCTRPAEHDAG